MSSLPYAYVMQVSKSYLFFNSDYLTCYFMVCFVFLSYSLRDCSCSLRAITFTFSHFSCILEHFTRDSLRWSKFLAMLLAMSEELGLDLFLSMLAICSSKNFWKSERWERVAQMLSALLCSSKIFSSILEKSLDLMRLS